MPYINELHKIEGVTDVYVIVPEADMNTRKEMGWNSSEYQSSESKVKFLINNKNQEIVALLEKYNNTETWCLFSGINSFPFVTKYFKLSLKYHLKRGIITEPPFLYNHPLWQHAIRFAIKDWKYIRYIDKLFVMGDDFLNYYRFWSKHWEVIPFMYCTTWNERRNSSLASNDKKLKILYVGSLSHRKNVQLLLNSVCALNKYDKSILHIGIIGDGEEKEDLEKIAALNNDIDITFYGIKPMNSIPSIMEEYDILCLPSRYDGWGAVVNEALTLGLYVICSTGCGSKYLIKKSNNQCGNIFKNENINSLCKVLRNCITKRESIKYEITNRIEWARHNIHGKIVAQYLINNLKS